MASVLHLYRDWLHFIVYIKLRLWSFPCRDIAMIINSSSEWNILNNNAENWTYRRYLYIIKPTMHRQISAYFLLCAFLILKTTIACMWYPRQWHRQMCGEVDSSTDERMMPEWTTHRLLGVTRCREPSHGNHLINWVCPKICWTLYRWGWRNDHIQYVDLLCSNIDLFKHQLKYFHFGNLGGWFYFGKTKYNNHIFLFY